MNLKQMKYLLICALFFNIYRIFGTHVLTRYWWSINVRLE